MESLKLGEIEVDARPEHIGPGYWRALHQFAYVMDTSQIPRAREMFVELLTRGTGAHFECLICRPHAVEYMTNTDPIQNLLKLPDVSKMKENPLFCLAWTYRFHETVNTRLNKPKSQRPTFAELVKYLSDLREGKGCHHCEVKPEEKAEIKTDARSAKIEQVRSIQRRLLD